jgi:hypothetical protein
MRWYVERNDVVYLTEQLEFHRIMALVAIKNEEAIDSLRLGPCMSFNVLEPFRPECVRSPAVIAHINTPFARYLIAIPGSEMALAGKDDKGRNRIAARADSLYDGDQLAILWLYSFRSMASYI